MGQCTCRVPGSWKNGFTLFELVVVLAILSLAALVVMPLASKGLESLELETTGRDLITRMKQARSQAIARQKAFRVILMKGEQEEEPDFYLLADEFEEAIGQFPLPKGVSLEVQDGEFPVRISFYPNGRSSGQMLAVRNKNGKELRISVDPLTGFARVIKERN